MQKSSWFGLRAVTVTSQSLARSASSEVPERLQVPLGKVCEIQAFEVVVEILSVSHRQSIVSKNAIKKKRKHLDE